MVDEYGKMCITLEHGQKRLSYLRSHESSKTWLKIVIKYRISD